jgi:uncharacterized protein
MHSIVFPTDQGKLPGMVHESASPGKGKVLLMCHGFRGSKDGGGRAVALAQRAAAQGFTAVRFDFTPTTCLTRQIREITAVVKGCRRLFAKPVVLLGRSMGGSASLAFAAIDCALAGLCLWSTPSDLYETFRLALGDKYQPLVTGERIEIDDEYGHLELTADFIKDFAQHNLLGSVKQIQGLPLLILHGTEDAIVPLAQAKVLFEQASEPKQLTIINGADHHFTQHAVQAADAVLSWLQTLNSTGIDSI